MKLFRKINELSNNVSTFFTKKVNQYLIFLITTILGGLIIYTLPFLIKDIPSNWSEYILGLGKAIIVSGLIGAITRLFIIHNIISDEISRVIFQPGSLGNPEIVWKRITSALYDEKFPRISDKLQTIVLENYNPHRKKYYYEKIKNHIDLTLKEHGYVESKETTTYKIEMCSNDRSAIKVKMTSFIDIEKNSDFKDMEFIRPEYIKVGAKAIQSLEIVNIIKKEKESEYLSISKTKEHLNFDVIRFGYVYEFTLKGDVEYTITKRETKSYYNNINELKSFLSGTIINNLEITIVHDGNFDVSIKTIGVSGKLQVDEVSSGSNRFLSLWLDKKSLILPSQGIEYKIETNNI